MTSYHIVVSPREESLPPLSDYCGLLVQYFKPLRYLASEEQGENKHLHYDCVITLKANKRTDSIKRTIITFLKLDDIERKNVKVYEIEEERLPYQIGYCRKEGLFHINNGFLAKELIEGELAYRNVEIPTKKHKKDGYWNIDEVAQNFLSTVEDCKEPKNLPTIFEAFLRNNRAKIKFSTYQRINKEKLFEYVDGV